MRKLFVVRGSEDGNLGVYSNIKRAYARAEEYLHGASGYTGRLIVSFLTEDQQNIIEKEATYRNVCLKLQTIGSCEIEGGSRTTCSIESFNLNQ